VTLIHGGRSTAFLGLPNEIQCVELEPLIFNGLTSNLSTPDGSDAMPTLVRRRQCLVEHLNRLRPRAILFEHFPFGRWGFREEIIPLLEYCLALDPKPLFWSSVRDIAILSTRDYIKMSEAAPLFDRIYVHSDPEIIPLDLGRPTPDTVASRLEYTGFVSPPVAAKTSRGLHVVAHAGGGHDGKEFWNAVNGLRLAKGNVFFTCCGETPGELMEQPSLMRLLRSAWRSVAMAGYNTVAEYLAFRTPTIFVPRPSVEQSTRVSRLQRIVGGPMIIADATPEALHSAWEALQNDKPFRRDVWINGQERFAQSVRPVFQ
jgi:predicted glycosyltransferase